MKKKFLTVAALLFAVVSVFAQNKLHETFENLEMYEVPDGWTIIEAGGSYGFEMGRTVEVTDGSTPSEMPCLYYGQWYDEIPAWIITPQLHVTSEDDSLTFYLKMEDLLGIGDVTDLFQVVVSTDNNETASFDIEHPLLTVEYDENEALVRYAVSLKGYLNQKIYLAFRIVPDEDMCDYFIAEINGPELYVATCEVPQQLAVSEINTTSAVFSWNAISGVESYTLQLLPDYYDDWSEVGLINNVTDTFYKFENLTPGLQYKVRVKSDCGSSESEFSVSERFVTINDIVVSVPYEMDFEQDDVKDYAFFSTNDLNKWYIGDADGYGTQTPKHSMYISSDKGQTLSYTDGKTAAYSVLRVQFPDDSLFKLSYNYKVKGIGQSWNGGMDFLCVYMLEDSVKVIADHDTNSMQTEAVKIQGNTYSTGEYPVYWESKSAVLNNVSGKTMQIVFMWKSDANHNWPPAAVIDNVKIETYTPCHDVDSVIEAAFCEDGFFEFNDHIYNTEGTYQVSVATEDGCDTNFTINLTMTPKSIIEISDTISNGMSYSFANKELTESGVYTDTLKNQNGCDSIITLNLFVRQCNAVIIDEEKFGCEGDTLIYNGLEFTNSATYTFNFITWDGCDSIVNLTYIQYPAFDTIIEAFIDKGDKYSENGFNEDNEGTYTLNLKTSDTGCDSIVTLILKYNPEDPCKYPSYDTINVSICDNESYTLGEQILTKSGTYSETLQRTDGCDSIVTVNLIVNPTYEISFSATIDQGTRYTENGFDTDTEGEHILNLKSQDGCDSTIILNLTFNNSINNIEVSDNVSVYPNPAKHTITVSGTNSVEIYDNRGRLVYKSDVIANKEYQGIITDGSVINISYLDAGIYYIKLGNKVEKLIIE
ncbi:MAG: choice-of-anchor J domain-containing protein [Bacteroidales bacterium]|nr:choice-of-anchor J domain-containing protein [Bacteroidales bacterium]